MTHYCIYIHCRLNDPKSKGYVYKSKFVSILQSHLGVNADIQTVVDLLTDESDWVPYPKFLVMFEDLKPLKRGPNRIEVNREMKPDDKVVNLL